MELIDKSRTTLKRCLPRDEEVQAPMIAFASAQNGAIRQYIEVFEINSLLSLSERLPVNATEIPRNEVFS